MIMLGIDKQKGTLEYMLLDSKQALLKLCYKHKGEWCKMYADIQNKTWEQEGDLPDCEQNYITILDNLYPQHLKESYQPPFVLFYEGDINLLSCDTTKLAVISSRQGDADTIDYVLDKDNKDVIYVLSGETDTDVRIIKEYDNPVIVVCAYSLQQYPYHLRKLIVEKGGVIVTAMPDNAFMSLSNDHFKKAKLIMGGLCNKALVVSCRDMSASLILVAQINTLGKQIYVVPTSVKESETFCNNKLIYEGALSVSSKQELTDSISDL